MNINATLFVQIFSFLIFVAFTKRYVWPPIVTAMQTRQDKIAQGLAEAEQARHSLLDAENKSELILKEARDQANQIIQRAEQQANAIKQEAELDAKVKADKTIERANNDIDVALEAARKKLIQDVASLVHRSAKRIMGDRVDAVISNDLIEEAILKIDEAS